MMTLYPVVSCCSPRAADCSQTIRVPVNRYVHVYNIDLCSHTMLPKPDRVTMRLCSLWMFSYDTICNFKVWGLVVSD